MKAIAVVGGSEQPASLLVDLLYWHGLSVFQVDSGSPLLPLLSFISPELVIVESGPNVDVQEVCDRIKYSSVVGHVPVLVCSHQSIASDHKSADAYLSGCYSVEDVFSHVQALRLLGQSLSAPKIAPSSVWADS